MLLHSTSQALGRKCPPLQAACAVPRMRSAKPHSRSTTTVLARGSCIRCGPVKVQGFRDAAPSPAALVAVDSGLKYRFIVPRHKVAFGQSLKIVGSLPELGSWQLDKAPSMQWKEGHNWVLELVLPAAAFEFKLVMVANGAAVHWEDGSNRAIKNDLGSGAELPAETAVYVACPWSSTRSTELTLALPKIPVEGMMKANRAALELLDARKEDDTAIKEALQLHLANVQALQAMIDAGTTTSPTSYSPKALFDDDSQLLIPLESLKVPPGVKAMVPVPIDQYAPPPASPEAAAAAAAAANGNGIYADAMQPASTDAVTAASVSSAALNGNGAYAAEPVALTTEAAAVAAPAAANAGVAPAAPELTADLLAAPGATSAAVSADTSALASPEPVPVPAPVAVLDTTTAAAAPAAAPTSVGADVVPAVYTATMAEAEAVTEALEAAVAADSVAVVAAALASETPVVPLLAPAEPNPEVERALAQAAAVAAEVAAVVAAAEAEAAAVAATSAAAAVATEQEIEPVAVMASAAEPAPAASAVFFEPAMNGNGMPIAAVPVTAAVDPVTTAAEIISAAAETVSEAAEAVTAAAAAAADTTTAPTILLTPVPVVAETTTSPLATAITASAATDTDGNSSTPPVSTGPLPGFMSNIVSGPSTSTDKVYVSASVEANGNGSSANGNGNGNGNGDVGEAEAGVEAEAEAQQPPLKAFMKNLLRGFGIAR